MDNGPLLLERIRGRAAIPRYAGAHFYRVNGLGIIIQQESESSSAGHFRVQLVKVSVHVRWSELRHGHNIILRRHAVRDE